MKVIIERLHDNGLSTLGVLFVVSDEGYILHELHTLELPYKNNERNISCIPVGMYWGVKRVSKKYGEHIHITNVPNRSFILIHPANYVHQLRGCIAVGTDLSDINNDELLDVTNSRIAMDELLEILPQEFSISIA